MSDATPPPAPRPWLGAGKIVADTLAVFVTRFPKVVLLCLPAGLSVVAVIFICFIEYDTAIRLALGLVSIEERMLYGLLVTSLAVGSAFGLATGPMARAALHFERSRRVPVRDCAGGLFIRPFHQIATGVLVAMMTLSLLGGLFLVPSVGVGLFLALFCIAVGMYAMGLWAPALPVIAVERMGFRALRRSMSLSKNYRWQSAGTFFLLFIIAMLGSGLITAGAVLIVGGVLIELLGLFQSLDGDLAALMTATLSVTVVAAILALGAAHIRMRLVEIKEPPDIGDMIDVFE